MKTPATWDEEYRAVLLIYMAQSRPGYAWNKNEQGEVEEEIIGEKHFAALRAKPVTAEELATITDARGEYRAGDTRGFVLDEEERCEQYNAWMVRNDDGTVRHLSEPAADFFAVKAE